MALNFTNEISTKTGGDGTEISFTSAPTQSIVGESSTFEFAITVGNDTDDGIDEKINAELNISLYVSGYNDGDVVNRKTIEAKEGETVDGKINHTFKADQTTDNGNVRTDSFIWIEVGVDYFYSGTDVDFEDRVVKGAKDEHTANTKSIKVKVAPKPSDPLEPTGEDGESKVKNAYDDTTEFRIEQIQYEDYAIVPELFQAYTNITDSNGNLQGYNVPIIPFGFENPTIKIDGAGRFAKHEIIGGTTVRQKIGEDPLNVSVSGVCSGDTANKIDSLRDARFGRIYSSRLPQQGDSLLVQFGSTSTEPLSDGGAADLKSGDLLYSYSINCIEVIK